MNLLKTIKEATDKLRFILAKNIAPKQEPKKLTKYEIFVLLLKIFPIVTVEVDTRIEGVVLPLTHMNLELVYIQYGVNLVRPITDLNIGSDGVSATLSFNRKPFKTFIPWVAINSMYPGTPNPVGPPPNLIGIKGGHFKEAQSSDPVLDRTYKMAA